MPRLMLCENLRGAIRFEVSYFPGGNCLKPIVKLGHIQGDGFLDVTEEQAREVLSQHRAFIEVVPVRPQPAAPGPPAPAKPKAKPTKKR